MARLNMYEPYGYEENERFSSIRTLIDDEILNNKNVDQKQSEEISAETSSREEEDVKINSRIDALESKDAELEAKDAELEAKDVELESAIGAEQSRAEEAESELDGKITDETNRAIGKEVELENAIDVINGDGEGSIKYVTAQAVAEIVAGAPDDFDTLKEIADYIASDKTGAAEINNKLDLYSGILEDHGDLIAANATAISEEASRATAKENELETAINSKAEESDLDNLSNRVQSLSGAVSDLKVYAENNISAISANIDETNANVSDIANKEGALESSFNEFVSGTYVSDKAAFEVSIEEVEANLEEELSGAVVTINEALNTKATIEQLNELDANVQEQFVEISGSTEAALLSKVDIEDFNEYQVEADAKFLQESDLDDYATISAMNETIAEAVEPLALKEDVDNVDNSLLTRIQNIERYISGDEGALTEINNTVANELLADPNTTKVTIANGSVSRVVVPDTTKVKTLTADLEDGAVITLEGTKSFNVAQKTSGVSINNLTLAAPAADATTTFTISANTKNVSVTNASLSVANGYEVQNVTLVSSSEDETSNMTVNAKFTTPATVNTDSYNNLTISSRNDPEENVDLTINAPNATVTLNSSWNSVESNVSDDTLYVGPKANIKTLIMTKGNVIVNDVLVSNRIENVVNPHNYKIDVARYDAVDASSFSKNVMKNGITTVKNDITCLSNIGYGILANGNYELRLGGHNVEVGGNNYGFYTRGTMEFDVYGENGTMTNNKSYLFWADGSSIINIHGGTYVGTTHCLYLYSKTATINVYDGDFKLTDSDKKFLVNYYDKVWDPNNKRIHIYGGRFYGFDPSNSMGEPSGPVNLLEPGYHVVHTVVEGEDVYEVVAD